MRTHLKRHLSQMSEGADEGFTLIELLVVLLILGILLAIAIPTFLTVTKSATNTAVTSNLQTALTGVDTYYTQNNGSYVGLTVSTTVSNITQEGTGLSYVSSAASTGSKVISIDRVDANDLVLAAWNGSNRCYAIADQKGSGNPLGLPAAEAAPGTYYGYLSNVTTSAGCTASAAKSGVTNWSTTGGFPS